MKTKTTWFAKPRHVEIPKKIPKNIILSRGYQ
jgi:hypothetical protein